MVRLRIYYTNPTTKKVSHLSLQSNQYTKEEIDKIRVDYKKWMEAGNTSGDFRHNRLPDSRFKQPSESKTESSSDEESSKPLFQKMHIDKLQVDKSLGGFSFAVIGSTKSGKSFATNYIVKEFFKNHITFLMSLTSHGKIYDPFRKKGIIAEKFCPQLIEEAFIINKNTNNHYDFLFVFDDLALDGKNDTMMTRLLTTGRNLGCSALISGQKATMLSATGRSNCNYVCLFYQNTDTEIESSVKTWLRSFFPRGMAIPDIIRYYREMTVDHNFFLIDTLNNKCYLSRI